MKKRKQKKILTQRIFLMEREISGYYYDGEKSWILYKDEYGNETMEEWKDESET